LKVPAGDKKVGPFDCEADEFCTNSPNVCVKKSEITASVRNVCEPYNGDCQRCEAGKKFTCASRTQGARCVNGQMSTSIIFDCGKDESCITDGEDILDTVCVPNCVVDFVSVR